MSKKALQAHIEELRPFLLRRKPVHLDDSPAVTKLKRDIQRWNSAALDLLKQTSGAKASATAFEELGRMKYGSLKDVKAQLLTRRKIIEKFIEGKKAPPSGLETSKRISSTARVTTPPTRKKTHEFDVCLSFAGEDRKYAKRLFDALTAKGLNVFYDARRDIAAELWGKDLYTYLDDVYQNRASFCVMFLSKHYRLKVWTNHERESAQARAFKENREYILPLRLDDTQVPGVRLTTGHRDWSVGVKQLTEDVISKLKQLDPTSALPMKSNTPVRATKTGSLKTRRAAADQRLRGHVVLLDNQLHVAQPLSRQKDGRMALTVKMSSPLALSKLRNLYTSPYRQGSVRFVDRFDASNVRVTMENETVQGRTTTVLLLLTPAGGQHPAYRVGIAGMAPEEIAQEQLRQLLLGEAPSQNRWYTALNNLPDEVKKGVLHLALRTRSDTDNILQLAEALAVYYIRQLNIVDDIDELRFSWMRAGQISCSFKANLKNHSGHDANLVIKSTLKIDDRNRL